MPTKIRLQQHGVRNHPYWWIIVQGPNRNTQGRLIEHMGFWIPRKCATVERSIVLNRPRLKYWLGTGAQPSVGVAKILQYAQFLPKQPPTWGSSSLYEHLPKPERPDLDPLVQRLGALKDRIEEVKQTEEMIKKARLLYDQNAATWLSYSRKPLANEMTAEQGEQTSNPGDVEKVFNQYAQLMGIFDKTVPNATNEQRYQLITMLSSMEQVMYEEVSAVKVMQELKITKSQADDIIDSYWAIRQGFTRSDLDDFKEELKRPRARDLVKGRGYIPSPNTITPVPKFDEDELNEVPRTVQNFITPLRPEKDHGARMVPRIMKYTSIFMKKNLPKDKH